MNLVKWKRIRGGGETGDGIWILGTTWDGVVLMVSCTCGNVARFLLMGGRAEEMGASGALDIGFVEWRLLDVRTLLMIVYVKEKTSPMFK